MHAWYSTEYLFATRIPPQLAHTNAEIRITKANKEQQQWRRRRLWRPIANSYKITWPNWMYFQFGGQPSTYYRRTRRISCNNNSDKKVKKKYCLCQQSVSVCVLCTRGPTPAFPHAALVAKKSTNTSTLMNNKLANNFVCHRLYKKKKNLWKKRTCAMRILWMHLWRRKAQGIAFTSIRRSFIYVYQNTDNQFYFIFHSKSIAIYHRTWKNPFEVHNATRENEPNRLEVTHE